MAWRWLGASRNAFEWARSGEVVAYGVPRIPELHTCRSPPLRRPLAWATDGRCVGFGFDRDGVGGCHHGSVDHVNGRVPDACLRANLYGRRRQNGLTSGRILPPPGARVTRGKTRPLLTLPPVGRPPRPAPPSSLCTGLRKISRRPGFAGGAHPGSGEPRPGRLLLKNSGHRGKGSTRKPGSAIVSCSAFRYREDRDVLCGHIFHLRRSC